MSGINFSYSFVQQLLAQEAQQAVGGGGSGSLVFPYFDPQSGTSDSAIDTQWTSGTSFDTSIPYNSDGTIDVNAMLQKLHDILYYSNQGDTMDYNSIMDSTAYLMNIGAVWGQLSGSEQSQVSAYLQLPVNSSGDTIIDLVTQIGIPAVIYGTYYETQSSDQTLAFAHNLINQLSTIVYGSNGNGGCPLLSSLLSEAQSLNGTLKAYMNQNPASGMTFNEFAFGQALDWQTAFSCNSGAASYFNSWRSTELGDLLAGAKGNPFLEYILIMYVLMNENGDMQTTIAGQGNLTNYLTTPMGNNAKEIANAFSAGGFTGTPPPISGVLPASIGTAQVFYNEIIALSSLAQNQSISSIAPQIAELFQAMTNPNSATQINVTFSFLASDDKNYTGETVSLAALFQGIQTGSPVTVTPPLPPGVTFTPTWKDMANALNALMPTSTGNTGNGGNNIPSFNTQPGYTTLSNLVQQVSNSITSKSTAIGQIMQNDEGVNEKDLSMIQAAAEEVISPEKQINQNMAQAGS